nr:hypothetical protein [Tanacetum cinerariifolium]
MKGVAAERVSDGTEEMATVLTSMYAATVLASRDVDVPTGSGSIHTASPHAAEVPTGSDVVPTASLVFATATVVTPYRRRKGKKIMVESKTLEKKKVARDAEIARIHAEEELRIELISDLVRYQDNYAKVHKLQAQQRKPWSKKQKTDYYMDVIRSNLGWKVKDFRGMTFEEIEAKFTTFWKQLEDFIPMGSKEEAERLKRKGLSLEQESAKKLKTSDEVPEEVNSPVEVPEEKVKEMMQLVLIEEVYVKALQVKHLIIDWKVHTEGQRSYWKIIRLGGSSASYQFFVDLLKHMDREDMNQLWALVKESFSNRQPTIEWKLYDMCEVHQVTSKDKEIFMLVEKDYPLRKGLALVMICYKLQVENYSHMANDLILKIYKIANCPSQQVIEFPLAEEVPSAIEESCHCQKKKEATDVKIALLLKSRRNYQSKLDDSYAKLVPHVTPETINIAQRLMDQIIKCGSMQGTSDHKRKFNDRRNSNNNSNYTNNHNNNFQNNRNNNINRNNDYHQQQNRRLKTFRAYAATPTENNGYTGNRPLCKKCTLHHSGPCTVKFQTCNRCSKANNNAHGKAYLLRDKNAHQDPNVVT